MSIDTLQRIAPAQYPPQLHGVDFLQTDVSFDRWATLSPRDTQILGQLARIAQTHNPATRSSYEPTVVGYLDDACFLPVTAGRRLYDPNNTTLLDRTERLALQTALLVDKTHMAGAARIRLTDEGQQRLRADKDYRELVGWHNLRPNDRALARKLWFDSISRLVRIAAHPNRKDI